MHTRTRKRIVNWNNFSESYEFDKLKLSILSGKPDLKLLYSHPSYLKIRTSPAVKFEQETGINGISEEYIMPFGLNNIEIENIALIFKKDSQIINLLYKELKKLNPELPNSDSTQKMYDVICGACSKFNLDDIKDFIENKTYIDKESNRLDLRILFNRKEDKIAYDFLWNKIKDFGVNLYWFPSLKTLDFIYKKIKKTI